MAQGGIGYCLGCRRPWDRSEADHTTTPCRECGHPFGVLRQGLIMKPRRLFPPSPQDALQISPQQAASVVGCQVSSPDMTIPWGGSEGTYTQTSAPAQAIQLQNVTYSVGGPLPREPCPICITSSRGMPSSNSRTERNIGLPTPVQLSPHPSTNVTAPEQICNACGYAMPSSKSSTGFNIRCKRCGNIEFPNELQPQRTVPQMVRNTAVPLSVTQVCVQQVPPPPNTNAPENVFQPIQQSTPIAKSGLPVQQDWRGLEMSQMSSVDQICNACGYAMPSNSTEINIRCKKCGYMEPQTPRSVPLHEPQMTPNTRVPFYLGPPLPSNNVLAPLFKPTGQPAQSIYFGDPYRWQPEVCMRCCSGMVPDPAVVPNELPFIPELYKPLYRLPAQGAERTNLPLRSQQSLNFYPPARAAAFRRAPGAAGMQLPWVPEVPRTTLRAAKNSAVYVRLPDPTGLPQRTSPAVFMRLRPLAGNVAPRSSQRQAVREFPDLQETLDGERHLQRQASEVLKRFITKANVNRQLATHYDSDVGELHHLRRNQAPAETDSIGPQLPQSTPVRVFRHPAAARRRLLPLSETVGSVSVSTQTGERRGRPASPSAVHDSQIPEQVRRRELMQGSLRSILPDDEGISILQSRRFREDFSSDRSDDGTSDSTANMYTGVRRLLR